jgi:ATP-binding cassette subfamily B protein
MESLRARNEWKFFGVLPQADRALAIAWWFVLLLRGLLPALFAIAMGVLVGAVQHAASLAMPLAVAGTVFVLLQVLSPLHRAIGENLGSRTAAWLYDKLTIACVGPPGMGHLEDPRLTTDLTMARDFDLGITGPPLAISMDFIASGMVELAGGVASAILLAAYAWWAPILLAGAWIATHWLLRESAIWRDRNTDEVREAQRHADYAYRLAVDPPSAKELRLFGLGLDRRALRVAATAPAGSAVARHAPARAVRIVELAAGIVCEHHGVLGDRQRCRRGAPLDLARAVTFISAAMGTSMIAFGGLSWALDGAAAPASRGAALRARWSRGRAPVRRPLGATNAGARDPVSQCELRYPPQPLRRPCSRQFRSDHSRRFVTGHRRPERRGQDHPRQAPMPSVRPAGGLDRDRRRRLREFALDAGARA